MHVPTAGVGLEARLAHRVAVRQPIDRPGIGIVGVPLEEPELALDRFRGAVEARRRELYARDRPPGREPGVEALVPRAVREELQRAGRLAPVEAEGVEELGFGEPADDARGRGRAEGTAGRRDVKALRVVGVGVDRLPERTGDVVAGRDAREEPLARGAGRLRDRERRRDRRRAGVQRRPPVGVVEVEAVGERPVDERRGVRRDALPGWEHGRGSVAGEPRDALAERRRRLGVGRPADRDAEPVEQVLS